MPLFASAKFRGKSKGGLYGDVIEELDSSVGQIFETLRRERLDRKTLVIFSSDNGPWLIFQNHGGSAGPLREGKGSTWEGGMRVPGIMWWPGRIPAGVTQNEMASTMDLFPTVAKLVKAPLPDREIDGIDISPLLFGSKESSLPRPFFYYRGETLFAARLGPWKAHFITQSGYGPDKPESHTPPLLFNLREDPGEKWSRAATNQPVLQEIQAAVEAHRQSLRPAPTQLAETVNP